METKLSILMGRDEKRGVGAGCRVGGLICKTFEENPFLFLSGNTFDL